jgi:hypothetical protein
MTQFTSSLNPSRSRVKVKNPSRGLWLSPGQSAPTNWRISVLSRLSIGRDGLVYGIAFGLDPLPAVLQNTLPM